jgi:hypothetical protein
MLLKRLLEISQLNKSPPANLHSTNTDIYSYMYSMTPKYVCSFLACEYSEVQGVLRRFRIYGSNRKPTQKKISAKHPYISGCKLLDTHTSHITWRFWSQSRMRRCPEIHTEIHTQNLQKEKFYVRTSLNR